MADDLRLASSPADFAAFASLITEYVAWCRERYRDHAWFVDRVFGHQDLAEELAGLQAAYSGQQGRTLLFVVDGEVRGAGAYRRRADGTCEMKRLFVPDRFRGQRLGRRLCEALLEAAREDGFTLMRLDTANLMTEAIALYSSCGFRPCAPYLDYPPDLMPFLVFMERPLTPEAQA